MKDDQKRFRSDELLCAACGGSGRTKIVTDSDYGDEVKDEAVRSWTISKTGIKGGAPERATVVVPKADYDRAIEERDTAALARIKELEAMNSRLFSRESEQRLVARQERDRAKAAEATLATQTKAIEREARELRKVGDHAFADRLDSILREQS